MCYKMTDRTVACDLFEKSYRLNNLLAMVEIMHKAYMDIGFDKSLVAAPLMYINNLQVALRQEQDKIVKMHDTIFGK